MNAIKKARRLIQAKPDDADSQALLALVMALETDSPFHLAKLYAMNFKGFELAMEILQEWRIDRYYLSKIKLMDLAWQYQQKAAE